MNKYIGVLRRSCYVVACIITWSVYGQAGRQDPSFAVKVDNPVSAIVVQSDERILVSGRFTNVNGHITIKMARLHPSGRVDTSFRSTIDRDVWDMELSPGGKIVIKGVFTEIDGIPRPGLARLNSDGSLDPTFASEHFEAFSTVTVQPDGKVLVGTDGGLVRLNVDGSRDTNFNVKVHWYQNVYTAAVLPGGQILMGGEFSQVNGLPANNVARLYSNGTVDLGFDTSGQNMGQHIEEIIPFPDGRYAVAGDDLAILLQDGRFDPTFRVVTSNIRAYLTMGRQRDGKLIVGGLFSSFQEVPRNIARTYTNAIVDLTFNPGTAANDSVITLALQRDGRILLGGYFTSYDGGTQPYLVRILNDQPVLDQRRIAPDQVELSWPAAYTNFVLQSASGVPSANWSSFPGTPVVVSNMCYVTNTATPGNQFFRLVRQEP